MYGGRACAGKPGDAAKGAGVDPLLFIVSRDQRDLHAYLTKEFRLDEHVQVILDRRLGDRPAAGPRDRDQRRGPRRRALSMDQQMRSAGFALVRRATDA